MKYIILLGDGMSDYPLTELGGKTPLQAAKTPNMDYLAAHGSVGLAQPGPGGRPPRSVSCQIVRIGRLGCLQRCPATKFIYGVIRHPVTKKNYVFHLKKPSLPHPHPNPPLEREGVKQSLLLQGEG